MCIRDRCSAVVIGWRVHDTVGRAYFFPEAFAHPNTVLFQDKMERATPDEQCLTLAYHRKEPSDILKNKTMQWLMRWLMQLLMQSLIQWLMRWLKQWLREYNGWPKSATYLCRSTGSLDVLLVFFVSTACRARYRAELRISGRCSRKQYIKLWRNFHYYTVSAVVSRPEHDIRVSVVRSK